MKSEKGSPPEKLTRTQQARRQDILSAAAQVISREGYAAASVEKIAAAAYTSKSTVLYHFKSKAAIERAVIESVFEAGAQYMAPFILAAQNVREKLTAYITSNIQFIASNATAIAALHEISRNMSQERFDGSSRLSQDEAPILWLRDLLAEGQQANELGAFDPLVMATSIRLVIDGSSRYILAHPTLDIAHYITEVVQLFQAATHRQKGGD